MYIETSSPRKLGDKAILESKEYPVLVNGRCLHFYYHMYGEHMGALKVLLSSGPGNEKELWSKNQDQGNQWHLAEVDIASAGPYKVGFGIKISR